MVHQLTGVFKQGVDRFTGEYHICLKDNINPVQYVTLREQLKKTIDNMVKGHIITPITDPTPWINLVVVVRKKNGALRIYLDPKELNTAIPRENYLLPTIEDVATRLYGVKVFSVHDVQSEHNRLEPIVLLKLPIICFAAMPQNSAYYALTLCSLY